MGYRLTSFFFWTLDWVHSNIVFLILLDPSSWILDYSRPFECRNPCHSPPHHHFVPTPRFFLVGKYVETWVFSSGDWRQVFSRWYIVSNIFYFHPYLVTWSNLTNIFQMGWNHQLVVDLHPETAFFFALGIFPGHPPQLCLVCFALSWTEWWWTGVHPNICPHFLES